jgi:diguanylate cyclase (GGDEF)-like protein
MRAWVARPRSRKDAAVLTAAWMYGGAAFAGLVESFVPGTPATPIGAALFSVVMTVALLLFGRWIPARLLPALGFLGIGLIAYSLAFTQSYGDTAALYAWPVLWTAYFFDRRTTIAAMATLGIAHALALSAMPDGVGYASRWIDVMVSMSIVATVVRLLGESEDNLTARLSDEARTDQLTGLLNRRGVNELIRAEVGHAHREGTSIGVIVLDLDHFKQINDAFGHEIGDRVLAHVGQALARRTRTIDLAARIGGEEFVVVLPRCGIDEARDTAERLRREISDARPANLPAITASAGVAAQAAPDDFQPLLQAADHALFRAKAAGRDRTMVAGPDLPPRGHRGAGDGTAVAALAHVPA